MLDRTPSEQVDARAYEAPPARSFAGHVEREFVGRASELAMLRTGLDTIRQGKGSTFLVTGEAGVGKTRLASRFTSELTTAGVRVVWGRCWEAGGAPSYWPWVEVMRQLVGSLEAPLDLGTQGRFLAQLAPDLAERFGVAGQDAPTPSDPESARFLMFDAVAGLLRRFTSSAPLAVVIDDLHAADHASLLLLTFLASRSEDVPFLIIATLRDREADVAADLARPLSDFARRATRVELDGLTKSDISSLLEAASGSDVSDDLVSRIHDATAGNAFFVDEVLRSLAGDGLPPAPRAPHDLGIPSGVRDAVRQRLTTLPSDTTDALELGAVIGREFDAPIVARALGRTGPDVLATLQPPLELGIIAPVGAQHGRFQFRHALIRDAIYESLPPARRVALHRRVGEALAELAPDRLLGEIAHHFLIAASAGDGRFVKYAAGAARLALGRMAFEEAVRLHERTLDALTTVPPDERLRCEVLLGLAEAKEWANDASGSRQCFEEAAAIARTLDATDLFVRAALGVGAVAARKFTATSRCESAPALLREAVRRIGPGETAWNARLLARLALHELSTASRPAALEMSGKAVELARSSFDRDALGQALIARHAALLGPDSMDERMEISRELIRIGIESGDQELEMRGHALQFTVVFELGRILEARKALDRHRQLAECSRDPFEGWVNLVWQAALALHEGSFDDAERLSRAAYDLVGKTPGPHNEDLYGPVSFLAQTILIDEGRGKLLLDPTSVKHYESNYQEASTWRVAWLGQLTNLDRVEAVQRELDLIMAHGLDDFDRNAFWLPSMSYVADAIELVGQVKYAEILYPLLLPFWHHNVSSSHLGSRGSVSRYLGLLASTLGRWDEAEQHFQGALEQNLRMRARPYIARTKYDWARLLARREDADCLERATKLLQEALEDAIELGMMELVGRCTTTTDEIRRKVEATRTTPRPDEVSLVPAGDTWIIHYAGKQTPVGSTKGMTYIAELLRHPDREILAIDLIRAFNGEPSTAPVPPRSAASRGIIRKPKHFTEDVVDAKARRAYQRQLHALEDELSSAEADGDPERVLELRDEIEQLERELSRGIGLGGRVRQSSDVERARISVTRTIHLAMGRIAEAAPEAGAALARCIRTGTYCCYVPAGVAEALGNAEIEAVAAV